MHHTKEVYTLFEMAGLTMGTYLILQALVSYLMSPIVNFGFKMSALQHLFFAQDKTRRFFEWTFEEQKQVFKVPEAYKYSPIKNLIDQLFTIRLDVSKYIQLFCMTQFCSRCKFCFKTGGKSHKLLKLYEKGSKKLDKEFDISH